MLQYLLVLHNYSTVQVVHHENFIVLRNIQNLRTSLPSSLLHRLSSFIYNAVHQITMLPRFYQPKRCPS